MEKLDKQWLLNIIKEGENSRVDFKKAIFTGDKERRRENQQLAQDLTAFANSYGGYLVIGITDEKEGKEIVGFMSDDQLMQRIVNVCRDWVQPPLRPQIYRISLEQGEVLVISVDEGKGDLCLVDGKVYIRVYNEVRQAVSEELTEIILRRHLSKAKELFHQSLKIRSNNSDNKVELADLLINVIQFNQHFIRTKDLFSELEELSSLQDKLEKLKDCDGKTVQELINLSEHLLARLNSADFAYVQEYIAELKNISQSLKELNPQLEEMLAQYYYCF